MECGKRVENGHLSYPCAVDSDHEGPCAAVEVPRTQEIRRRWEAQKIARDEQMRYQESGLAEFQGQPRTSAEGLHADPTAVTQHPDAVSKCIYCPELIMNKHMTGHIRDWHASRTGPIGSAPTKQREGDQRLPAVNDRPFVQDAVIADIEARKQVGIKRYGTALQPFNGRSALQDAYEEAMDLCIYLKQCLIEASEKAVGAPAPKTGAEHYFDERLQDPEYREAHDAALQRLADENPTVPEHLLLRLRQREEQQRARIGAHFADRATGDTGD